MRTHHVPWTERLGVRLAAAITLICLIVLAVSDLLMIRSQQRHLTSQALRTAAIVSDTITSSIHNDMMIDRREEAYRAMDAIASQPQISRLRVIDAVGQIRYSRDPSEIGTKVDLKADSCQPCHRSGAANAAALLTAEGRTHITERNGRRVLGAITPIYNEMSCAMASCHAHPASQAIIGVLELGLPLDVIDNESAALRRNTIGLSALTAVALAALTLLLVRRVVVRPVMQIVDATTRVAHGELRPDLPVHGSGELAVLQTSFNRMGEALAATRAERDVLLDNLEHQVAERTEALEQARARLAQTEKLSSLGRLSASIAHEINNPLAGILTTAKLLLRSLDEIPTPAGLANMKRRLSLVQRECERCSAIVRNLLGFARERPLALDTVDVNAAVDEALFLAANQIALQNIQLHQVRGVVPTVRADFGQIRQAVANILLNACDAMPTGGTLSVETSAADGGIVTVRITDTGSGIPKDVLSKVLDPFFTTKEKGTGLGLSVVYGIVERHGGKLNIDSEEGRGTRVSIALRAAPAEDVAGDAA